MRLAILGVLLCSFAPAAEPDAAKKALADLDGDWTIESLVFNGEDLTGKVKLRFVIKAGVMTLKGDEAVEKDYLKIGLKLDPTTDPKCVDLTILDGGQKGTVMEGIAELNGDELRLCIKTQGSDRPTEFKSVENSAVALLKLKR